MRIRSAIVVGSFAAASGAYPQLSIPPEAGKGANSKWHLPPRIRPRVGASDGPTAAREPPPAPAPRGARKPPPFDRRLLGRRRRRRRRAEEERQGRLLRVARRPASFSSAPSTLSTRRAVDDWTTQANQAHGRPRHQVRQDRRRRGARVDGREGVVVLVVVERRLLQRRGRREEALGHAPQERRRPARVLEEVDSRGHRPAPAAARRTRSGRRVSIHTTSTLPSRRWRDGGVISPGSHRRERHKSQQRKNGYQEGKGRGERLL